MKILILGGTRSIGAQLIGALRNVEGSELFIINRGKSVPRYPGFPVLRARPCHRARVVD